MDKPAKIIVALVIIVVSGFFIFSKISGWHKTKLEKAVKQEQQVWQGQTNRLERKVSELSQELTEVKGQKVPEEKLAKIFGTKEENKETPRPAGETKAEPRPSRETKAEPRLARETKAGPRAAGETKEESRPAGETKAEPRPAGEMKTSPQKLSGIAETERRIAAFFTYLDNRPYIQSLKPAGGSYLQYQIAVEKLSAKPPIIVGEMRSLYNMIRNVAHFYRVMGKTRVRLTKQILQNESEVMETVMKTFYQWFTMDDGGRATLNGRPSMTAMYEYAGYILNTLGGRSYLLRRSPKIRALTTYYSVLILDRANNEELNSRGIDIRPYIKSSLLEIKNQIGLIHQREYITRLSELSLKYT
jgi:hypothetical protein